MISVVIPAFNCEKYIKSAVESVLAQDYSDYEILVIDDGSVDHSRDIVLSFGDRVRYFYQENSGAGAARNKGITEARGEYIAFLDADDVWFSDKLSFQLDMLKRHEADMVYARSCFIDACGRVEDCGQSEQSVGDCDVWRRYFEELFWWNDIPTSSVLIKKECLEKFGVFDEDRRITEDYDLWLRIVSKVKIIGFGKAVFYYRDHDFGISKDPASVGKIKEVLTRNYKRFLVDEPVIKGKLKKRLVKLYFDQGHSYFNRNQMKQARSLFFEGMRVSFFSKCTVFYLFCFFGLSTINCIPKFKKIFK